MGRAPTHHTDEDRATARSASKAKWKNVSLDADLVEALNAVCDRMEKSLGFRPTLSQAVRNLIKNGEQNADS